MADKGMSQSALAREIGVSQGAVSLILKGHTSKSRYIPDIAGALDVSIAWLEGEADEPGHAHSRSAVARALADEGLARVQEFDLSYAMGGGTFLDAQQGAGVRFRHFDLEWLREMTDSDPGSLFVARGLGDSMLPTLLDNDRLIIDTKQKFINQQDRLWALAYGDLGMVKRVRRLPGGRYLIISDNPSISDFEVDSSEFHVVGRVVGISRRA
ncbi:S24 family peptidase [Sphingomonas naphthae]|uniref:S24 family peptidase n=1 Tax=Sphingomonas naphthae TaxID=1813468 RepID=A0ABY7TP50_9SPHN|nr:S24 family peptidase [Sphingomonas naphthae]WCT75017.1 S24 family peptidase [Sphingomonas naphthae]